MKAGVKTCVRWKKEQREPDSVPQPRGAGASVLTAGKESRGCQTFDQVMVCIAVLLKVKDIEIHVFVTIILILSQG